MSLEADLRTYLLTQTGVTNLVGSRIHPSRLPDNPTLPAVVYQRISTLHNLASGNVPLTRARIQLDVWADSYAEAVTGAEALHAALDMVSATGIHASFPEDDESGYDESALKHRRRIDMFIWKVT
jgi:hypothetical protein